MIRNIISVSTVILVTAIGVVINLIILPLHNRGMVIWSRLVLAISGIRLDVHGRERLKASGSYIFLINPESALDIPIAVAATRKSSRFMAKKELFRVPFFGWLLKLCNHIPIDRGNRQKAVESINSVSSKLVKKKISIIVSPEGTRSVDGKIMPFKKGAFHLAEKYDLPLVPVTIMGARHCMPNKTLRIFPGTVTVQIGAPVYLSYYHTIDECIEDVRQNMINQKENYEQKRLSQT